MNAENNSIHLKLFDMHCAGCVASIEKALKSVSGVVLAEVNFANKSAQVQGQVSSEVLINAVKEAGYNAELEQLDHLVERDREQSKQWSIEYKRALRRSFFSGSLGFVLMFSMWLNWLPKVSSTGSMMFWLLISTLVLIVMYFSGRSYYTGAWRQFKRGKANMDTLVALGTSAAWIYSLLIVLFPATVAINASHTYFESALIILAFLNIGSALESKARGKTADAISKLIQLQPPEARLLNNGEEKLVSVDSVKLGDVLRLKPGDQVPVDGVVIEGRATLDQSMINGESIPCEKTAGDELIAGSLNSGGSVDFKASKIGKDTLLASIIEYVKKAQNSKPEIAKLVDKIAAVFVPIVLIIAVINAIVWTLVEPQVSYAFETTLSILIIACPCALGLATPISLIIGMGKAAEAGVLIRDGQVMNLARNIDTIVFDKTGTLSEGRPKLIDIINISDKTDDHLLELTASLEKYSEHPLANAVQEYVKENRIETKDITEFESVVGRGISATLDERKIFIGNLLYLQENGFVCDELEKEIEGLVDAALSLMFIAELNSNNNEQKTLGALVFQDPLKHDTKDVCLQLKKSGKRLVILSGDNARATNAVADELGINEVYASLLPEQKAEKISDLKRQGCCVAMVGDGINDAPALVNADVGIAIGKGTDIAIESSSVTLLSGSLQGLLSLVKISKSTITNIKQNLFWAFIYNVLSIPIAAGMLVLLGGGLLNPMFAGAAMAMSSLTVVLNASRLHRLNIS